MKENGHDFIMKVAKSVNLKPIPNSHLPDGSYLSKLKGKIEASSTSRSGRKKWDKVEVTVRVIVFQVPGFRQVRLITSILDRAITAIDIVIHYHKRWDIEIAYDEIKTHQCATLRGQAPTILRSKRGDFIEQELFSILITFNLIRSIMAKAAELEGADALSISFIDTMAIIIDGAPFITMDLGSSRTNEMMKYMYEMIRTSPIDRPRRKRCSPRVVKVKMSNFKRKRKNDKSVYRNFEENIQIIPRVQIF